MKKLIPMLVTAVLVLTMLVSCGKPFTCDLCREEKTGKQNTATVLGQEVVYCNDCKKELDKVGKGIEDLGDEFKDLGNDIKDGIDDLADGLSDMFQ